MAKSYKDYAETVKSSVSEIRTTLTELTEEDCSSVKLKEINDKLQNISVGNELLINVTADDYEGATFTATHEDTETIVTGEISQKKVTLKVPKGGTYTVTNDADEQSKEAVLIDSVDVDFVKFKASIKVTIPTELLGETITCTLAEDVKEQKAETTSVTFEVRKKGTWTIGVKGNTTIKNTVNVQNAQTYSTQLTIDPAKVMSITVRSKEEDNGKTIKCTKSQTILQKVLKDRQCTFLIPETGTWKVTCDDYPEITKSVNVTESKAYRCALRSSVFGITITETESEPTNRVTYRDDAADMSPIKVNLSDGSVDYGEWKDYWPFEKIYPVMLSTSGTIAYKLNPDDQTKKAAGGTSDINSISYNGNAMVCMETFYTKFSMEGGNEVIQISDEQEDGFEPIGFIRSDGSVADKVFLPMFGGNKDQNGKLRSIGNQDWTYNISWTDSVTAAEKNGSGYGIESWAMNQAFSAVVTILIKSCDWQKKLGEGRSYSGAKTGILTNKGAFGYDPSTKAVKVLWVEDFVSNVSNGMWRWEAGILSTNNKVYVKMKPPYSGTETSGYTEVTDHVGTNGSSKFISKMKADNKYGRIPVAYEGSQTTYENAYWYTSNQSDVRVSRRSHFYGVWGRNFLNSASHSTDVLGAALSFLPPA